MTNIRGQLVLDPHQKGHNHMTGRRNFGSSFFGINEPLFLKINNSRIFDRHPFVEKSSAFEDSRCASAMRFFLDSIRQFPRKIRGCAG
jgi:hypothetical protein